MSHYVLVCTLALLRADEVLDERVGGLRVERERVLQRLKVLALVHVGDLEADAAGVEVLLHRLQGSLQHGTLLRGQGPLGAVLDVLRGRETEGVILNAGM